MFYRKSADQLLHFFLAYAYVFLYNFVRISFANERAHESIRIVEGLNDQSTKDHDTDKSIERKGGNVT